MGVVYVIFLGRVISLVKRERTTAGLKIKDFYRGIRIISNRDKLSNLRDRRKKLRDRGVMMDMKRKLEIKKYVKIH